MKKIIFYFAILLTSLQINAQVITKSGPWLEAAFVEWTPVSGANSYNVYYTGGNLTNIKIDTQLIRSYGTYFRADIPGLAAGTYTITIKPVTAGAEGAGTSTSSITVLAHDRTGFAFDSGRLPGGYKVDGTPKTGAVILYITENTKNTISMNITGATTNPCIGLQNILYAIKKGKDNRPFIIRLIGNITDMIVLDGGDITIENANNTQNYVTFEGVGSDAVANGWGVRLKNSTNIEINNLGFMNCNSTAGDDVGMQQGNDHIWVHNCDMYYGDAGSAADQVKGDGSLDNKDSSYCTFSYNHFWDNGKCSLLGLNEGTTIGLYVTYHHNWFDHSDSRHPRVRYYSAHVYNNYFDGNSKYGSGSTNGSSLFVEGNYFRDCKHPMMTSMQGTDVWNETTQANDPTNMGTFSGEVGGTIKAFNNTFDASNGANNMRFVAYGDTNSLYNISGKISSTVDFDAYVVTNRGDQVPSSVKSFLGANMHNNFDTDPAFYVKNLTIDQPAIAKGKVIQYSGRVSGGDLKFTFNNDVDDAAYLVNTAIKTALTNYTTTLVAVQGDGASTTVISSQTLTSTTNNNQSVSNGSAIGIIIFTWGGDATDAAVTGLPASGIVFVKDIPTKTITITGTPTAIVSYSITTSGATGTPATGSGIISTGAIADGDEIHNYTAQDKVNTFYAITGNLSTIKGTVTYSGLTLTQCLKIETATSITYKTTQASTLTLVFVETVPTIKFDGTNYTGSGGIITISVAAGSHTIAKVNTVNLFFMKTIYNTLGLDQKAAEPKFILYPNPVANLLYLATTDYQIENAMIYNLTGALVKTISNVSETIDVSDLNSGVYLVKLTTDQGSYTQRIIKK